MTGGSLHVVAGVVGALAVGRDGPPDRTQLESGGTGERLSSVHTQGTLQWGE